MAISPRLANLSRTRTLWYAAAAATAAAVAAAVIPMTHASAATFPTANGSEGVGTTKKISGNFDGRMKRFFGTGKLGVDGQEEGGGPIFELADGAVLRNAIIGKPAADGVWCRGNCVIENVWWEDVGEDAITFRPARANQTLTVRGGAARKASDKVIQHNGPGGTLIVDGFQVDDFNKLYRSCGNCQSGQGTRHVVLKNITVTAPGKTLVGLNANYGDTATFSNVTIVGDPKKKITICERYEGNSTGKEPKKLGKGPDSKHCKYTESSLRYR